MIYLKCMNICLETIAVERELETIMSTNTKLTGADYLLLLLYVNDCAPIKSAVRLIKMMFLFNKEIVPLLTKQGAEIDNLPEFDSYNYGPFSKDVYEQIELFNNIGFIKVTDLKNIENMDEIDDWEEDSFINELLEPVEPYLRSSNGKYMQYIILQLGTRYVEENIIPFVSEKQLQLLAQFKNRIVSSSIKSILRYVYIKYPEMTSNSLIKSEVLGYE